MNGNKRGFATGFKLQSLTKVNSLSAGNIKQFHWTKAKTCFMCDEKHQEE